MKTYLIYIHTNKINGKKYIGKTCQDPAIRFGSNGIGYRACPLFYRAIKKYGWENFEHEIVLSGLSFEEANEKEQEYIQAYKSQDRRYGYNIRVGGQGMESEDSLALWSNPEYKKHMIKINEERWLDEDFKKDMKTRMKKAWEDPEKRNRRSLRATARWADPEFHAKAQKAVKEACAKKIMCVETGVIYDSVADAADTLGLVRANGSRAARTGYRWGGYHWVYC